MEIPRCENRCNLRARSFDRVERSVGSSSAWFILSASVIFVAILVAIIASAEDPPEGEQVPSLKIIQHLASNYNVPLLDERLVDAVPIPAPITKLNAASVRILTRAPALEFSLIKLQDSWFPLLVNKNLGADWEAAAEEAIRGITLPSHPDAMGLARELTRILVDSESRYGIALGGRQSIPVDYESSAVLHYLKKEGMSAEEISMRLLQRLKARVAPPVILQVKKKQRLVFFTWHYFGGEVSRWVHV